MNVPVDTVRPDMKSGTIRLTPNAVPEVRVRANKKGFVTYAPQRAKANPPLIEFGGRRGVQHAQTEFNW